MKWLWIILGLLIVGAIVILFQDSAPSLRAGAASAPSGQSTVDRSPVRPSPLPPSGEAAKPGEAGNGDSAAAASPVANATSPAATAGASSTATPAAAPSRPLPTIEHATVVAGSLERQPDGSIIADTRFHITGAGTAADPYRVSWECLASAQETYVPRLSEHVLPERIAMLDGKVVRMEGYISFPLLMKESRELILMLNQWDGCCIGVPPTPYDAIEVKLSEPAQNTRRHAGFTYGSVTGTFRVEPFLVENWLVGLYLLEDATYEPEGL